MPNLNAPPVRRTINKGVTKEAYESLPPPLKRVAKINRDADKNKRIGK